MIEKNPSIVDAILHILEDQAYDIKVLSEGKTAVDFRLKRDFYGLVIIGTCNNFETPFDLMKETVVTSPISSIILIMDATDTAVEQKAEGYVILGHIRRTIPSGDLRKLLNRFEEISKAMDKIKT